MSLPNLFVAFSLSFGSWVDVDSFVFWVPVEVRRAFCVRWNGMGHGGGCGGNFVERGVHSFAFVVCSHGGCCMCACACARVCACVRLSACVCWCVRVCACTALRFVQFVTSCHDASCVGQGFHVQVAVGQCHARVGAQRALSAEIKGRTETRCLSGGLEGGFEGTFKGGFTCVCPCMHVHMDMLARVQSGVCVRACACACARVCARVHACAWHGSLLCDAASGRVSFRFMCRLIFVFIFVCTPQRSVGAAVRDGVGLACACAGVGGGGGGSGGERVGADRRGGSL